ncbi:MAG: hypothetical protein ACLFP1_01400 [Candidatus Goldiibacteriota bacterium]
MKRSRQPEKISITDRISPKESGAPLLISRKKPMMPVIDKIKPMSLRIIFINI